ncbi:MAG: hypothetical protein QM526_01375 [Alphaproteobacteria bacterium]|nr:hypothetical protein [Alphaproteobacteria bacterium]
MQHAMPMRITYHNGIYSLTKYSDSKSILLACKYENDTKATQMIATYLSRGLSDILLDIDSDEILHTQKHSRVIHIAPIPPSATRIKTHGIDHLTNIATLCVNALTPTYNIRVRPMFVYKKNVSEQHTLNKKDRLKNMINAFDCNTLPPKEDLIIILDDVTTTNATIVSARETLVRKGHTHVLCIAFARVY